MGDQYGNNWTTNDLKSYSTTYGDTGASGDGSYDKFRHVLPGAEVNTTATIISNGPSLNGEAWDANRGPFWIELGYRYFHNGTGSEDAGLSSWITAGRTLIGGEEKHSTNDLAAANAGFGYRQNENHFRVNANIVVPDDILIYDPDNTSVGHWAGTLWFSLRVVRWKKTYPVGFYYDGGDGTLDSTSTTTSFWNDDLVARDLRQIDNDDIGTSSQGIWSRLSQYFSNQITPIQYRGGETYSFDSHNFSYGYNAMQRVSWDIDVNNVNNRSTSALTGS